MFTLVCWVYVIGSLVLYSAEVYGLFHTEDGKHLATALMRSFYRTIIKYGKEHDKQYTKQVKLFSGRIMLWLCMVLAALLWPYFLFKYFHGLK